MPAGSHSAVSIGTTERHIHKWEPQRFVVRDAAAGAFVGVGIQKSSTRRDSLAAALPQTNETHSLTKFAKFSNKPQTVFYHAIVSVTTTTKTLCTYQSYA